jgi:hypothetical protein
MNSAVHSAGRRAIHSQLEEPSTVSAQARLGSSGVGGLGNRAESAGRGGDCGHVGLAVRRGAAACKFSSTPFPGPYSGDFRSAGMVSMADDATNMLCSIAGLIMAFSGFAA